MSPVRFSAAATAEIEDGADGYDTADPGNGVGDDFRRAVREAGRTIQANPAIVALIPRGRGFRQYILPDYPYSLIYRDEPGLIRVVAVAHQKRRPGYWKRRIGP